SRPLEYPALLLTHTLPLAAAYVPLAGAGPTALAVLVASLALRLVVAWRVTALAGGVETLRWLPWLPVRDLLSTAVWLVGAVGIGVTWRGRRYRVRADGRMSAEDAISPDERHAHPDSLPDAAAQEPEPPAGRGAKSKSA
ncbi:MAG: hypothetical protein P8Z81_15135, partial [Deinococcales bacterium]